MQNKAIKSVFSMMLVLVMVLAPVVSIIPAAFSVGAPENSVESEDGPGSIITALGDDLTEVELMRLTRTTATTSESGNMFSADSGVYTDVSNLTIMSNNMKKDIGGTGRTPIVFNNAQTTSGWKPISVAGINNADAFQIKFSTLGYENIKFTCSQKSTGSGPDAFLLAYSVGSPTGTFTIISNSETGTNGIPPISRMSNDTYSALMPSYAHFVLPSEMDNQSEVYLRVVFNGLTNLGQNGNTSINNIVIVGDGKGNSDGVVDKNALNELISQASQKIESEYTTTTWTVFAAVYANAQTVAADNNATQSEVNSARADLQSAMDGLKRSGEVIEVIEWPGASGLKVWDTTKTFAADSSGLDFHNGQLYAVDNGTGKMWILNVALDGTVSLASGFENGKTVRFKSVQSSNGPDAEGITVDGDGFVYIASERDNSRNNVNWNVILKVDPSASGTSLTAIREWDITASLPQVSVNAGIEAVEWVPNAEVSGKLFDKNTNAPFNPSNYPNAIAGGVFFVALEANGHVYAYVLYDDETFVQIADIDSKLGGAMALDYDMYEHVLWVMADNGFGNRGAKMTFIGGPTVEIVHVKPPGGLNINGNYEGFAIADASYTVDGQRPVYRFEDGPTSRSLTIGSLACDYELAAGGDGISNITASYNGSSAVSVSGTAQGLSLIEIVMFKDVSEWNSMILNPADGAFSNTVSTGKLESGTYTVYVTGYLVSNGSATYGTTTFTVTISVTGVALNQSTVKLGIGKDAQLTATVLPQDADDKIVTWSSSDESVATVVNGKVTALKVGTATITVTTNDGGFTADCTVTVIPPISATCDISNGVVMVDVSVDLGTGATWGSVYIEFDDGSFFKATVSLGSVGEFIISQSLGGKTVVGYNVFIYDKKPVFGANVVLLGLLSGTV